MFLNGQSQEDAKCMLVQEITMFNSAAYALLFLEYAIMSDTLPDKEKHTSLLVNQIEYVAVNMMKNYDFTDCKALYDKLKQDRYDTIRDDNRFIAVLEKIKPYC